MTRTTAPVAPLLAAVLLAVVPAGRADEPKTPPARPAPAIDVKLTDDSVVKLTLLDPAVEFVTPHGKLTIPVSEIRRIDLGLRIPDEVAAVLRTAAADLGSGQFRKREEAMRTLLGLREKAYPTLKGMAKASDAEVARRAGELVDKLEEVVPKNRLELPEHDVIHTDLSKIAGKIVAPTLKARSFAFGEVSLNLADVAAMSVNGFRDKAEVVNALPDPGSLTAYQQPQHLGKTFAFRVTGQATGSLWGTGTYTLDSTLAMAAVHAGVVKVGEAGIVKVTILGPMAGFVGSTQNGITSSAYPNYPGAYQIHTK